MEPATKWRRELRKRCKAAGVQVTWFKYRDDVLDVLINHSSGGTKEFPVKRCSIRFVAVSGRTAPLMRWFLQTFNVTSINFFNSTPEIPHEPQYLAPIVSVLRDLDYHNKLTFGNINFIGDFGRTMGVVPLYANIYLHFSKNSSEQAKGVVNVPETFRGRLTLALIFGFGILPSIIPALRVQHLAINSSEFAPQSLAIKHLAENRYLRSLEIVCPMSCSNDGYGYGLGYMSTKPFIALAKSTSLHTISIHQLRDSDI